eukprot:jgi/Mesen1/1373/ME000013S00862
MRRCCTGDMKALKDQAKTCSKHLPSYIRVCSSFVEKSLNDFELVAARLNRDEATVGAPLKLEESMGSRSSCERSTENSKLQSKSTPLLPADNGGRQNRKTGSACIGSNHHTHLILSSASLHIPIYSALQPTVEAFFDSHQADSQTKHAEHAMPQTPLTSLAGHSICKSFLGLPVPAKPKPNNILPASCLLLQPAGLLLNSSLRHPNVVIPAWKFARHLTSATTARGSSKSMSGPCLSTHSTWQWPGRLHPLRALREPPSCQRVAGGGPSVRCFSQAAAIPPLVDVGQPTPESHPEILAPGELLPGMPAALFAARRAAALERMPPGSVLVVGAATIKRMAGIIPYPYRQDADYLYLTGCMQPGGIAVLKKGGGDEAALRGFSMFMPHESREV